ncbi:hypothetical protein M409DRAFT_20575 [Zasmidium cellare ATCC 36951]|uniref:Fork-head domain-containing protein n=1 Tax=Zasmidium cellare ATCC 36951 TaxID=1080233 RepID=A0A6A6CQK5_ZASCE|nr:uncharacterized protein M409DRAFT_20575 [Zasmidium cellare ATCC 36951]KAF2169351.1 hypothetical protein M409DRAFT_20575 [Zasmidium cellare ATCC 36951]
MCVLYRDPALPLVPPPGFRHADESLNEAARSAAALEQEELPDLGPVFEVVQAYRQQEERRKQIKVVLRGQPSVAFLEIGQQKGSEIADPDANKNIHHHHPSPSISATDGRAIPTEQPLPHLNLARDAAIVHLEPRPNGGFAIGAAPVPTLSPTPVGVLWPSQLQRLFGGHFQPKFKGPVNRTPPRLVSRAYTAAKLSLLRLKTSIQNYEAGPPLLPQTMESAGLHETPLQHRHHSPNLHVMPSDLGTPAHVTDHGVPSNLRSTEDNLFDQPFPPELDPVGANDLPLDHPTLFTTSSHDHEPATPVPNSLEHDATSVALDSVLEAQPGPLTSEQLQESGYAMLSFADSYHVLKHPNLVIVRDENYQRRAQAEKKMEKREARRREIQERHTQQALNDYAQEPSQPSQTGDDVAPYPSSGSGDGDALEGRPARGLLSHYSEQGGPVAYYPPSDDDAERFRRRERRRIKPSSSSATSIAPNDLHQFDTITMSARDGEAYTGSAATDDGENWAQLPVHTANPDDIKQISREHLIFSYDPENLRWVLHVVGNNAYVGDQLYRKGDKDIPLESGTEIFISTLRIVFRLPIQLDNFESVDSDEEVDELDEAATDADSTPERPLSKSSEVDVDDEDAEEPERKTQKPIKLKLKAPKAPAKEPSAGKDKGKGKGKGKGKEPPAKASGKSKAIEAKASEQPDSAKPADKGKEKEALEAAAARFGPEAVAKTLEQNGSRPANILPGSILEGLAPNEMPEKRKGPGRPPKNGFLSKRDERAVMRRQKEYERRGLTVPEFNAILAEVREEQKAKDAAAKGNKLRPEGVPDAVESIEAADQPQDGVGGQTQPGDSHTSQSADPAAGLAGPSGLTRRPLRSPSPMKPAEEFTEEELKKPQASYFYLLDEILQAVGQADLQTIYDKFQKRWPYYKYSVTTNGWQSSIRHNLSQFSRFKPVGKVGKGQLWAIDYNAPREENTKKKKTPPPPRHPQGPMQNGSMPPGMPPPYQHGQHPPQQYPPRYNQGVYNPGQGQYSSPYGSQGGQYQPHGNPGPAGYNQIMPQVNGRPVNPQAHMQPPPAPMPQPVPPANPVQAITADIMQFRNVHMERFPPEGPLYDAESKKFFQGVDYFSAIFHGQGKKEEHYPGEEALQTEPWVTLKAIFDRHDTRGSIGANSQSAESNGATNGQGQSQVEGQRPGDNGVASGQTNGQTMPPQQPHPAPQQVPQQVQQQSGHQGAPNMAPPTHVMPNVAQGVQNSVASQNAAAAAQTAQMPPVNPAGPNVQPGPQQAIHPSPIQPDVQMSDGPTGVNGAQQPTATQVATAPTPVQPALQRPDGQFGVSTAQQPMVAPASTSVQPDMQKSGAQLDIKNEQQPAVTTPVLAEVLPQQTPTASQPAPPADQSKQSSPSGEQPRPVSAGVKRSAADVEMQDAETEAKRLRTE